MKTLLKRYKAIYTQGQLHWVTDAPSIPEGSRVVVVVETEEPPTPVLDDTRQVMQPAGALRVVVRLWMTVT